MGLSLSLRLRGYHLAVAGAAFVAIAASGLAFYLTTPSRAQIRRHDAASALEALHAGRDREAQLYAESLLRDPALEYEFLGIPSYVLGIVSVREGDLATIPRQRQLLFLIAARYLDQAYDVGFPRGEVEEGEYWRAYALKAAGRRTDALRALREALERPSPHEVELKLLLADLALDASPRRAEESLKLLDSVDPIRLQSMRPMWKRDAIRTRVDALTIRQDHAGIRRYLDSLDASALTPAVRQLYACRAATLAARELAGSGAQDETRARALAGETKDALESIVEADLEHFSHVSERLYLIGANLRMLGDDAGAWRYFGRVAELGSEESLPALLEAARMMKASERENERIDTVRRAVGLIGDPDQYSNVWVSLDEVRQELLNLLEEYRAAQRWTQAAEVSALFFPLFDQGATLLVRAETFRDWGDALLARSENAPPGDDETLRLDGRAKLQHAGEAFAALAEVRFADRSYVQDRLNAGDAYFRGNSFRDAIRQYDAALNYAPKSLKADAALGLGRCLLSLGEDEEALKYLLTVEREHSTHPAVYSARYWAAMAYLEIGDLDASASRLESNLYESDLTPESRDWRDSLFRFGDVLYRKGIALRTKAQEIAGGDPLEDEKLRRRLRADAEDALTRSIRVYEEASTRFPRDERNLRTRYAAAVAWRALAQSMRDEIGEADIEVTRAALVQKMRDRLASALPWYENIYRDLAGKKDDGTLRPDESTLLRNVTFAKADVLYDLGRYQQAIEAYATASNRYHNQPEALEALVQMSRCYRELGREEDARGKIAQAKDLLARMPEDSDFAATTRGTREEWIAMLDLLGQF